MSQILIPPLHRGCDLSASIMRPQNWPGRHWRQKGGRTVALVVQWWYTGRSDIAMDAIVAVKFWACSKQSHKGRQGGRSLTGRSKEAGGRQTHRRSGRMDAQWSAIGRPVIPPLHRGCDFCASLVRPQNWPGRRWRQKGGRTVALVVQGWHIGRSDIAMDAMVAVKFWACSKQSHKGRRGGRSLTGRSKEAGWRPTRRRGRRMDAQWSAIGRPVKMRTLRINLSDTSAFLVPPLCLLWPTNGVHWAITVTNTVPPFSGHGNTWATMAMVLPSLCLLCATCCATTAALVVQGRHKGRAAAVTQKHYFLGSGDHWAS